MSSSKDRSADMHTQEWGCSECAHGVAVRFSGMFLFEPKGGCIAVHVPSVALHGYVFRHGRSVIPMERNSVWEVSCTHPENGSTKGLACPVVKDFSSVETTLRHCKIMMPMPCCIEPVLPLQVDIQGPVVNPGGQVVYHFFSFHYSRGTSVTVVPDAGSPKTLSKGIFEFHAEPMSDMSAKKMGKMATTHPGTAFRELSRMVCKSETISVSIPAVSKSARSKGPFSDEGQHDQFEIFGTRIQHCFSVLAEKH
jgi:hypothetical protein